MSEAAELFTAAEVGVGVSSATLLAAASTWLSSSLLTVGAVTV